MRPPSTVCVHSPITNLICIKITFPILQVEEGLGNRSVYLHLSCNIGCVIHESRLEDSLTTTTQPLSSLCRLSSLIIFGNYTIVKLDFSLKMLFD
jgi:hypothetical protein